MPAGAFGRLQGQDVLLAGLFGDTASQRRSAEDLLCVLRRAGVTTRPFDLADAFGRPAVIAVPNAYLAQELAVFAVTDIIIVAPPELTNRATKLLRGIVSGTPRVIAFWDSQLEGNDAAMQLAAQMLDAIWAPTAHLANKALSSLANYAGEIDIVQPRTIAMPDLFEDRAAMRSRLGLPTSGFVIGVELIIDGLLAGQNPAGIINAFRTAFDDDHDAWLVLCCELPNEITSEFTELVQAAKHARILVFNTSRHFVPRASIFRVADVWLSLPSDEADRSTVDDALGAGVQVVACAHGLSTEQWSHPLLHPVRFTRTVTGDQKLEWVTPELGHAVHLLRSLRKQGAGDALPLRSLQRA